MLWKLLLTSLCFLHIRLQAHPGHGAAINDTASNSLHWLTDHPVLSALILSTLVYGILKRRAEASAK